MMNDAERKATGPRVTIRDGAVEGDGIRFHYHEAGAGPALLCLGGNANFSPMCALLAAHYRVIALETPDRKSVV